VPAGGLNVGAGAGCGWLIVYAAELTRLLEYPGAAAIARSVSLVLTLIGAEYKVEPELGLLPSVV